MIILHTISFKLLIAMEVDTQIQFYKANNKVQNINVFLFI